MADIADRADERIENQIADGIEEARRRINSMPPVGFCYWCDSEVAPGRVFCDRECAADWEHAKQRRKELGR